MCYPCTMVVARLRTARLFQDGVPGPAHATRARGKREAGWRAATAPLRRAGDFRIARLYLNSLSPAALTALDSGAVGAAKPGARAPRRTRAAACRTAAASAAHATRAFGSYLGTPRVGGADLAALQRCARMPSCRSERRVERRRTPLSALGGHAPGRAGNRAALCTTPESAVVASGGSVRS